MSVEKKNEDEKPLPKKPSGDELSADGSSALEEALPEPIRQAIADAPAPVRKKMAEFYAEFSRSSGALPFPPELLNHPDVLNKLLQNQERDRDRRFELVRSQQRAVIEHEKKTALRSYWLLLLCFALLAFVVVYLLVEKSPQDFSSVFPYLVAIAAAAYAGYGFGRAKH